MLKKVSPGEPFRPRSSAWNEVIDKVSVTSPIPRTLPSLMPSQAMAMVEANTPAFVPVKLDPNPVKNSTSPDIPSYQLATESTTGEAIIGITLESSGAINKPIRVCIQGVTYAKVTADPELDPNVTPPFAVYDSENETLKTSMDYARIRILQFDSAKPSLISIDNESTILAKSSASETAPVDINRQSLGNISGLSFGTNLSCGVNAQEKQALAVNIGTRTTCTYEQTSEDGCTTETVTFEMSGEHALAIDGGLRVLLADEQRESSQEYTDPTTGITSNGGPDKFVGGGLRITFDDPIPAISGITTPGLSIRLRDEQVGEPNQYYPDVLRHNANGLYIAPEVESCAQGLDVMLTTNNNFGTMMPGKGLAVATSEITETAEDGTQTTTIIPNYGVVDVQVCECTCLKINEANEIEFTGNINYEGGIAINVNDRTINLQVCQGNGLIVNADNQLQYTGSGGGGATYTAGDYIGIDANNVICAKVCTCSLLTVTTAGEITTRFPCRATALTQTNLQTTLVLQRDLFPSIFKNATSFFGAKVDGAMSVGDLLTAVDVTKGLDVDDCSTDLANLKIARVKVDGTTIDFGSSGELTALTGISSVVQASGVPEEGQGGWVTTMYHPMLYHCGSDAIISYRQLMRVAGGQLQVSHQRAFAPGGSWEEYFGA